jgi:ABC-type methionine transport system ATPase subunit
MSGAGKSTLVRSINFLEKPTDGQVFIDGVDLATLTEKELRKKRSEIGMIFQSFNLLEQKSVIDNVCFPLEIAGISKKEARERARKLLETVNISEKERSYPSQLSGGQKQRVAIARAIVNNPKVLLADEPTGALDQKSGAAIMELFQKLNDEGTTIIMITHDANIASHAKKTYRIVDGCLFDGLEQEADE